MKKLIGVLALAFLLALPSTYAQTTDFFQLARTGTLQSVQAAIKNGANLKAHNKDGMTSLMYAAANNQNPEVVTTLLKAGADLQAHNKDGMTPLMGAAGLNKNPEVIATLLKAGADAKVKDHAGATAVDYAQGNAKLKGTDAYRQLQEASQ